MMTTDELNEQIGALRDILDAFLPPYGFVLETELADGGPPKWIGRVLSIRDPSPYVETEPRTTPEQAVEEARAMVLAKAKRRHQ